MKHEVVITPRAIIEMSEAALWWAEHRSEEQARRWLHGIKRRISDLADHPERHPIARESDQFPFDLRQLSFGLGRSVTHRIIFRVKSDTVEVLGIRHMSQRDLSADDL